MNEVLCERCGAPLYGVPYFIKHPKYSDVCKTCALRLNPPKMFIGKMRNTKSIFNITLSRPENLIKISDFEHCGWFVRLICEDYSEERRFEKLWLLEFMGTKRCPLIDSIKYDLPEHFSECHNRLCQTGMPLMG